MASTSVKSAAIEQYVVNATYGVYAYKSGNVVTVYINYNNSNISANLGVLPENFRPIHAVNFRNYYGDYSFRIRTDGGVFTIDTPNAWASATVTYITNS